MTSPGPERLRVPAAARVTDGNAGHGTVTLTFSRWSGGTTVCTYTGGASVMEPTDPTDLAAGGQYLFSSCTGGEVPSTVIKATGLELHVASCDGAFPRTAVAVALPIPPPCDAEGPPPLPPPTPGHPVHPCVPAGRTCQTDLCHEPGVCDRDHICVSGPAVPVDDGNPCTADSCDPATGDILHTPLVAGSSCDDATVCDGHETCDGAAHCLAGTPLDCNDQNACTADSCDAVTGCRHAPVSQGTSCDDATVCNGHETCDGSGACQAGAPLNCDDGNPCTAEACDPALGCVQTPVAAGTTCGDGTLCTGPQSCDGAGTCVTGAPLDCDDGNPCTADSCDPSTGCQHTPLPYSTSCGSTDFCTGYQYCDGWGECLTYTMSCDDGNPCTADSCDSITGCQHTPLAPGNACTTDKCAGTQTCDAAGQCVTVQPPLIDDGNPCTADACDLTTGITHTPLPAGTSCSDGNYCNGAETCDDKGSCLAGLPVTDDPTCNRQAGDPTLDPSLMTNFAAATDYLYAGSNPVQTGVVPGTLETFHLGVVRGHVKGPDGSPLPGVEVEVLDHPEYGTTTSQADGTFDIAVNGGGQLTLVFQGPDDNDLPVQRTANVPWNDYAFVQDVVMTQRDASVTVVATDSVDYQLASGSQETDDRGTRTAILMFPSRTSATEVLPDGTRTPLATLHVRATEFTVGPNGPDAMPAEIAQGTAYTYAVDLSADEATGGAHIEFDKPVPVYVDNFLSMPVGAAVPSGYYDAQRGTWVPSQDGVVLKIVSVTNGLADIDLNGDGAPEDVATLAQAGIDDGERAQLASLYPVGQTLWRVPVEHFTVYDFNWDYFATNATAPAPGAPTSRQPPVNDTCKGMGSIIDFQNQALGEHVGLDGTPLALNYESDRVPGWLPPVLDIPITGPTLPPNLLAARVQVDIAGQQVLSPIFSAPATNLHWSFQWNGLDGWGRRVQGPQTYSVLVTYLYPATNVYTPYRPNGYQTFGDRVWTDTTTNLGFFETVGLSTWTGTGTLSPGYLGPQGGIGGWSLSTHHVYDPSGLVLYLGDGTTRHADPLGPWEKQVSWKRCSLGSTTAPCVGASFDIAPDGTFYLAQPDIGIRPFYRDVIPGALEVVPPEGSATLLRLADRVGHDNGIISDLHADAHGNLYFDLLINYDHWELGGPFDQIWETSKDGTMRRVAGVNSYAYDIPTTTVGKLATNVGIDNRSFWVGPDGSVYLSDTARLEYDPYQLWGVFDFYPESGIVRQITTSGLIRIIGDPNGPPPAEGSNINAASLKGCPFFAVDGQGAYYFGCENPVTGVTLEVWRAGQDGVAHRIVGGGSTPWYPWQAPAQGRNVSVGRTADHMWVDRAGDVFLSLLEHLPYTGGQYTNEDSLVEYTPDGTLQHVMGSVSTYDYYGDNAGPGNPLSTDWFPDGLDYMLTPEFPYTTSLAEGPSGLLHLSGQVPVAGTGQNMGQLDWAVPSPVVTSSWPKVPDQPIRVPSEDGSEVYLFTPFGRHLLTLDAATGALLWKFAYDPDPSHGGRLVAVTDRSGNVTRFDYPVSNQVVVTGPYGEQDTLSLDSNGYLADVVNANGEDHRFEYEAATGLMTHEWDPRGGEHDFIYYSDGRLESDTQVGVGGTTLSQSTSGATSTVTATTAGGLTTKYYTTAAGGVESRANEFPGNVWVTSAEDSTGNVTLREPDGSTTTEQMTADPRYSSLVQYPSSKTLSLPSGQKLTGIENRTIVAASAQSDFSSMTDTTTTNGKSYATKVDRTSNTITLTTPAGRQSGMTYDYAGRVTSVQVPGVLPVVYAYDDIDHGVLRSVSQGAKTTTFGYSPLGYLASITNVQGHTLQFTNFDGVGRPQTELLPDGSAIQLSYDRNGNVLTLTPPGQPAHGMTYTPGDALASYAPPDVGEDDLTTYVYNSDRQLWKIERGSALTPVVTNAYQDGRLSTTTFDRGTTTRGYYADGRLNTITTPDRNVLTYRYNGPLVTSEAWSGAVTGTEGWTYNNDLLVGTQVVNGTATQYGYDNDGLITSLGVGSGSMTLTPDATTGQLDGTVAGEVTDGYTYYPDGSIHEYSASGPGGVLYDLDYTRDTLGRVTVKKETLAGTAHTYAYTYWPNGELWQVYVDKLNTTGDGPPTDPSVKADVTYTYDANGNRSARTLADGTSTTAVVNAQDQLTDYGQTHYAYDAKGALQSKTDASQQTTTYNYDEVGNLTHAGLPDGTSVDYIIDGRNRRIGKKIDGTLAESYLWNGQLRVVQETQGTHQLYFGYASHLNVPDLMMRDGVLYRIITDQLGSPRLVLNMTDGSVAEEIDYDEFGNITKDTSPGFQPFGFAGGLYDPDIELVAFAARDYDPRTGCWSAKDPTLFAGGETSLYGYADEDPVNYVDSLGAKTTVPKIKYAVKDVKGNPLPGSQGATGPDVTSDFTGCRRRSNGSWGFDATDSVTIETTIRRGMRNAPSADTPGKTLLQHEMLHRHDFARACTAQEFEHHVPTEGFPTLQACFMAKLGYHDALDQYLDDVGSESHQRRDR